MSTFTGISGQSLFDVCLNCYGGLDNMVKLMVDSGVENLDEPVKTGKQFTYDPELIVNQQVSQITTQTGVIFATAAMNNGNIFAIVDGSGTRPKRPITSVPNNDNKVSRSYKTAQAQYTATTDDETLISLPDLTGVDVFAVEKEIKPLGTGEWSWNKTTAVLTLAGVVLEKDATLYIYYQQLVQV